MRYQITLKDGRILIAYPYAPLLTVTEDHSQHGTREKFDLTYANEIEVGDVILETKIWSSSTEWVYSAVTNKEIYKEDLKPHWDLYKLNNGFGG